MTRAILLWFFLPQLVAVPAGEEILRRVEAARASVQDYAVSLEITADLENARIPPMEATMYFKQPDRVHFTSDGFALLPKEAFTLNPAGILERFRIDSVTAEADGGGKGYHLWLAPRGERAGIAGGWLRVSSERWTIDGGDLRFADGRTLSVRFRHERVGTVWLPSELLISLSPPPGTGIVPPDEPKSFPIGRSTPLRGIITIRFSGYRLNSGLSDDLFESPRSPSGR